MYTSNWFPYTTLMNVIAFNRAVQMVKPDLADKLFGPVTTWVKAETKTTCVSANVTDLDSNCMDTWRGDIRVDTDRRSGLCVLRRHPRVVLLLSQ